jgi:hypothetical protein
MSRTTAPAAQSLPYTFDAFGWEVFAERLPQAPFKWFDSWHEGGGKTIHVGRWLVVVGKK